MSSSVLTLEQARDSGMEVVTGGKGAHAVHEVVTAMRAARRSGSANTKTRAEVIASHSKPWRQKGTGRARAGSRASPIWRGGGVVFGPKPRDYSKKVNRSQRRLALRAALGGRIESGDVILVPDFAVPDGKTRTFVGHLSELAGSPKALIVAEEFTAETKLAARNVKPAVLATAREVNTEQILRHQKIVITEDCLSILAGRTRKA